MAKEQSEKNIYGHLGEIIEDILKLSFLDLAKASLCSFMNIIIYLVIAIFIIGFAQGYVIPVDLYMPNDSGSFVLNLFVFHFLLFFLAMIMSLYPTYIFAVLFERNQNKYYDSKYKGLIFYSFPTKTEDDKKTKNKLETERYFEYKQTEFTEKLTRKFLGVSLFNIWSWIIIYVYCHHQTVHNSNKENILILVNILFTLLFLYGFWYFAVKVKRKLQSPECLDNNQTNHNFADTHLLNKSYKYHLLILAGLVVGLAVFVKYSQWGFLTILMQLFICLVISMYLILFRTFRAYIPKLCDIYNLLAYFRIMGVCAMLYLIAINLSSTLAEASNPINIILLYLIAFYTFFVLATKLFLFLKNKNYDERTKTNFDNYFQILNFKFNLTGYKILFIFSLAYFVISCFKTNDLHTLKQVQTEDKISLNDFYESFKENNSTSSKPIFYAAYGGGLKAHYWNLMILDELDKECKIQDVLAMSGVSGGGMGIGSFTATKYIEAMRNETVNFQSQVKCSNVLGLELSWLFGKDLIRSYFPKSIPVGKDRSYRSMTFYSNKLRVPELLNCVSFQDAYANVFHHNSYYPNIIINSTSTSDKYGIVSGVGGQKIFPGAIDLLNFSSLDEKNGKTSLTYYEALSTCNRFPLISPAANIKTKGQFLDGGYFENSGILSLLSFKEAIEKFEKENNYIDSLSIFTKRPVLVSVTNDKIHYLESILSDQGHDLQELQNQNVICKKPKSEIGAIIGGIASLERLPSYLKNNLEGYKDTEFEYCNIDLPFYIDTSEVYDLIGTLDKETYIAVTEIIKISNDTITNILKKYCPEYDLTKWGVINPPTARILSHPVELYMKTMMDNHPRVRHQIEEIIKIDSTYTTSFSLDKTQPE